MLSHELLNVLFMLALIHADVSSVAVTFTASSNPTYSGSNVTFTCSPGVKNPTQSSTSNDNYMFKISSLSSSGQNDYVECPSSNSTTGNSGLFISGVTNCKSRSLDVSFTANVTFAGPYKCQVYPANSDSAGENALELTVYEAPSPPEIRPLLLTFNENDPMLIECISSNGRPPAEIELQIIGNALMIATSTAWNMTLLRLNASIALHDATVLCQVKNHLLPNMTATSIIKVNHIVLRPGINASQSALDSDVLNCSNLVDSFPPPVFMWSNLSAPAVPMIASSGSFRPVGYSGNLSCTATNNVTQKSVVVTFYIKKDSTTTQPATSSSTAWLQSTASSGVTKTSTSTLRSLSWTSAKASGGTTINTTTSRFSSTQGSSVMALVTGTVTASTASLTVRSSSWTSAKASDGTTLITMTQPSVSTQDISISTSVTGSDTNSAESLQNNEPIIIGVTVSVSLLLAAVVVTIIILRHYRKRTPPSNLPPSQSTSKIIEDSQLSESQGDNAEDFVRMTVNDLYGSSPPFCDEYRSSVIYDEPNYKPSAGSSMLATSHIEDSPSHLLRPYERVSIENTGMDDRSTASTQNGTLQEHQESPAALGEAPCNRPPDIYAVPNKITASVRTNEPLDDTTVSQQSFTEGDPPHSRSFDNMAYMEIQLDVRNAPGDQLHKED